VGLGGDAWSEEVAKGILADALSTQSVGAGAEELEEVEVSEDLGERSFDSLSLRMTIHVG
jgi:hypothetical protein